MFRLCSMYVFCLCYVHVLVLFWLCSGYILSILCLTFRLCSICHSVFCFRSIYVLSIFRLYYILVLSTFRLCSVHVQTMFCWNCRHSDSVGLGWILMGFVGFSQVGFSRNSLLELHGPQLKNGTALAHADSLYVFWPHWRWQLWGLDHDKEEWQGISRLGTGALTGAVGGAAGIPLCTDPGACQTPVYIWHFVIYLLGILVWLLLYLLYSQIQAASNLGSRPHMIFQQAPGPSHSSGWQGSNVGRIRSMGKALYPYLINWTNLFKIAYIGLQCLGNVCKISGDRTYFWERHWHYMIFIFQQSSMQKDPAVQGWEWDK